MVAPQGHPESTHVRFALNGEIGRALHLSLLNRQILLTPFHNMMLVSPATREEDVTKLTPMLAETFDELIGAGDRS